MARSDSDHSNYLAARPIKYEYLDLILINPISWLLNQTTDENPDLILINPISSLVNPNTDQY